MNKIPPKLRDQLSRDPFYRKCTRSIDGGCSGRITWEHAFTYAGKQIQAKWCIIPLCEKHHGVEHYNGSDSLLDKGINMSIALNRATDEELSFYSKANFIQDRNNLNRMHKFRYKGGLQTD